MTKTRSLVHSGYFRVLRPKIRIAHAMGIIGPVTRKDLTILNEIRNVFAHAPHPVTLKEDRLFKRVLELRVLRPYTQDGGYLTGAEATILSN